MKKSATRIQEPTFAANGSPSEFKMNRNHFTLFFAIFMAILDASLLPRKQKSKKPYKEALRWLTSSGVDPNIKKLVLEYIIPLEVVQTYATTLPSVERMSNAGKLKLPKMIAIGHSELARVKENAVHVTDFAGSSKATQWSREGAFPTAMSYIDSEKDTLVIGYNDGVVLGYTNKQKDFEVNTGKGVKALTVSKGVLYVARDGSIDTWDVLKGELLNSYPFDETVDNLHVQERTLFIHTTSFNHHVLKEDWDKPKLLDTHCRTVSYGMELGERLCYGVLKNVIYYASLNAHGFTWKVRNSNVIGARLVPHEKAAMIIAKKGIELWGTEDGALLDTLNFGDAYSSFSANDAEVMKSGHSGAVMVQEDRNDGRGMMIYQVADRRKMMKKVISGRHPSMCIIL